MAASLNCSKMAHDFIFDFCPRTAVLPWRPTPLLVVNAGTGAVTLSSVTVTLKPGLASSWPPDSTQDAAPPPACTLSLMRMGDGRTRKSLRAVIVNCASIGNLSVMQPRVYTQHSINPSINCIRPRPDMQLVQQVACATSCMFVQHVAHTCNKLHIASTKNRACRLVAQSCSTFLQLVACCVDLLHVWMHCRQQIVDSSLIFINHVTVSSVN